MKISNNHKKSKIYDIKYLNFYKLLLYTIIYKRNRTLPLFNFLLYVLFVYNQTIIIKLYTHETE
jgi:hypothetical protein